MSENFPFLVVNFSIYLNRRVYVMIMSGTCYCKETHTKIWHYFPIITQRRHDMTERLLKVALNLSSNKQSDCPDQYAQPHSLIRDFAVRLQNPWIMLNVSIYMYISKSLSIYMYIPKSLSIYMYIPKSLSIYMYIPKFLIRFAG